MSYCPQDKLFFTGDLDRCPLCGTALEGEKTPSPFPAHVVQQSKKRATGALAISTLCCAALVLWLGFAAGASWLYTGAALGALALNFIFLRNMVVHSPNFLRVVERYFLVLLAVALLFLLATHNHAVGTYVIPVLCITALLCNSILLVVFRASFVRTYAKYLLYDLVLGFVPLGLWLLGLSTSAPLAIGSALMAVVLLALLLLLTRRSLHSEMGKLFDA